MLIFIKIGYLHFQIDLIYFSCIVEVHNGSILPVFYIFTTQQQLNSPVY